MVTRWRPVWVFSLLIGQFLLGFFRMFTGSFMNRFVNKIHLKWGVTPTKDFQVLCNYVQNMASDVLEAYLLNSGFTRQTVQDCLSESGTPVCKKQKMDATDTGANTFRVSCKLAKTSSKFTNAKELSTALGGIIQRKTGWEINLRKPETEVVIHINHEGTVIGVPLYPKPLANRGYILHTGLRSTIAWIISSLADIKEGDTVLDPMCGNAIVLIEAAKEIQKASFMGCDICSEATTQARENVRYAGEADHLQIIRADATDLPLRSGSVDKIVCDLPFGKKFGKAETLSELYPLVLASMDRVLKPGGTAVLLTSTGLKETLLGSCSLGRVEGINLSQKSPQVHASSKLELDLKETNACNKCCTNETDTDELKDVECDKVGDIASKLPELQSTDFQQKACSKSPAQITETNILGKKHTKTKGEDNPPLEGNRQNEDLSPTAEKCSDLNNTDISARTVSNAINWVFKESHPLSLGEMHSVACVFSKINSS